MKKLVAALSAFAFAGSALAFMPQAGIWSISPERNGQPGRGFNLDVQNSTLVMQMYGYEKSGAPTFYLSAGQISNNAYTGQLFQYAGGRYMGGPAQSAYETGSAGTVKMRFVSGIKGYITFPGEEEKEIVRYTFAYSTDAASLKGIWMFNGLNSLTPTSDFVILETNIGPTSGGSGLVMSVDGKFGCEQQVSGNLAGTVMCMHFNSSGKVDRGYQFTYSVNDGEGLLINGAGGVVSAAIARRLANTQAVGTGITLKSSSAQENAPPTLEDADALKSAFEDFALRSTGM